MTQDETALKILAAIITNEGAAHPGAEYQKGDTYEKLIALDVKRAKDYAASFLKSCGEDE
jgi:hypothetical protein